MTACSPPLPTAGGAGGEASLYTANLRQAQNTDYFVGNGAPVDLTTEFLWHGFRYIEVTGLKEADVKRIQRQLMTDDLLSTAAISVSGDDDGMLNKILANARRGILSNYKGIPMDCPQRDERMPWLGDRTMGCFGESYVTQNHTLYTKWMQDICDAQRPDGNISDVCPAYWRLYNGNITWPAALPFGMEMLRLQYGDERPMREHADNVKRFLDFAKRKSGKDGLITYDRYGDWCVPPATLDEVITKDSTRMTDGALLSSCYYYYICKLMGMDEEAAVTREAINRTFLKDGCYANGTVTANPSMNSGNHVMMLGDLVPWAYECVAGIAPDPAKPGFKHIVMRPDFSIGVGQLFFQNQIAASRVFLRKAAISEMLPLMS